MQTDADANIFFGRRPVNPRLAWDPCLPEPTPDKTARGNINYDRATNSGKPAIVFALDTWRGRDAVITANGWYLRSGGGEYRWNEIQMPLPDPIPTCDPESDLAWFRNLLRLDAPEHNAAWETLVAWMLRALQPDDRLEFRGYPILIFTGPPDTGKSITAKLLTELLDPTREPIHVLTSSVRRVQGLVANHHVLLFDDTGKVSAERSKLLCGEARQVKFARPVILTTRSKEETRLLAERSMYVEMPPVGKPMHPHDVWQKFEGLRPMILGAVLTLLSRNFNAQADTASQESFL